MFEQRRAPMSDDAITGDIEVARYALRTFDLSYGTLASVYKNQHVWEDGVCVAKCLRTDKEVHKPPCKNPPGKDCACGIYGTVTLESLIKQYRRQAAQCVAVIAAEGETIVGDRGLRTAAARIVAYWVSDQMAHQILLDGSGGARHFTSIPDMLAEYKFPVFTGVFPVVPSMIPRPISKDPWEAISPLLKGATPEGIAAIKRVMGLT